MFENVTAFIERVVIQEKKIPYFDIMAFRNHKLLYRHMAGTDGMPTGKERLCMYSCTKPLTVVCAMRLVEEGRLSLLDHVSQFLPAFANLRIEDADGGIRPATVPMTIRHLLTMSGGFSYDLDSPSIRAARQASGGKAGTVEMANAFAGEPLGFEPGECFRYSKCHDILAAVVEVVSGMRFSEYMGKIIFEPLGMGDSNFALGDLSRFPKEYFARQDGTLIPWDGSTYRYFCLTENFESGGAGLVSTLEDYGKFADTLACNGCAANGYRLLKPETIRAIATPQMQCPTFSNTFTCVQGNDYAYGLGMRVRKAPTSWGLSVGEFGWDGAAGSYLLADPSRGISVVMGMNLLNWPARFQGTHLEIVREIYQNL